MKVLDQLSIVKLAIAKEKRAQVSRLSARKKRPKLGVRERIKRLTSKNDAKRIIKKKNDSIKEMDECRSYNVIEANSLTSSKTFDSRIEQSYVSKLLASTVHLAIATVKKEHTEESTEYCERERIKRLASKHYRIIKKNESKQALQPAVEKNGRWRYNLRNATLLL